MAGWGEQFNFGRIISTPILLKYSHQQDWVSLLRHTNGLFFDSNYFFTLFLFSLHWSTLPEKFPVQAL